MKTNIETSKSPINKLLYFLSNLLPISMDHNKGFNFSPSSKRNAIVSIAKFEFLEHFRNKWIVIYAFSFFALASLIIYLGGANPLQASGSLLSLVLMLVPIFSLIFGSIAFSETLAFMELLAAQPVQRKHIYIGKYLGLSVSLSLAYLAGMGAAALLRINSTGQGLDTFIMLLALGVMLSFVFVALAFLMANLSNKKELVFGLVLSLWFYFFILHDLILFAVVASFGDYPLEWFVLLMSLANPIDLGRVLISLSMDISSLMGASGAIMNKFVGGNTGAAFGFLVLFVWGLIPLIVGIKLFNKRNL